jgi:smad nuclear-interacting protein 1
MSERGFTFGEPSRGEPRRRRSVSIDSEEERRRRRRRRDREEEEIRKGRKEIEDRPSEGARDRRRDHYDDRERERKRRRSRSPESSSRRHSDRDLEHKSRRDRPSGPPERGGKDRSSREGSDALVSRRSKASLLSQEASFQLEKDPSAVVLAANGDVVEKQKPNFAPSGLLAAASNSVAQADGTSIVLKYHEPAEARKPPAKDIWKLFVFKGSDIVETIELGIRSCWLIGRELAVVDMGAEHPSISKQHAVIQFRYIEKRNDFGDKIGRVRPYLLDLESANGTKLNGDTVEGSRYLELRDKDMIQLGHSTREYVLMLQPKD